MPPRPRPVRPAPEPVRPRPAAALTHTLTVEVDLVRTGLTEPGDVPLRPAAGPVRPVLPVTDRDSFVVGGDEAYHRGALRRVLVVVALVLLLVAAVSLLAALRSGSGGLLGP